ncbi:MAG: HAMP domain-containing histidine kinase [Bacteriovorax sp.]|jgi:signal transduction histidine kinase|nr:HAMP domain-containing histidine kinase [Bacteriovorax sp.]
MKLLQKLSLKLKLTLLFGFIFTSMLAGFSYILYQEFSKIQSDEFDTTLYNYAIDVAESLDIDKYGEVEFNPDIIKLNEKILPFALGTSYISVLDINGKIIAKSSNATDEHIKPVSEYKLGRVLKKGASYDILTFKKIPHRVIHYLLPVLKIDSPLILQISVPMTSYMNTNKNLIRFFVTSVPIMMFLSAFIGYFFVGRSLLPMLDIINKTKKIEVSNLEERVPVPETKDEIWLLADTINHLLSRLQESFDSQERFIQDASHQLKTPLAIIKGELELFCSEKRGERESAQFFESMTQEIHFLIKLTNDLLILARVDSGTSFLLFTKNRLDEIILTQTSRLSKFAFLKKISLQINFDSFEKSEDDELLISCDPDLLGVLFYNLIENAIKYSPENSKVEIVGKTDGDFLIVAISDEGDGIDEAQLAKVFDRFFRVEGSFKRAQGSGLGLAICKGVADSLRAQLWAENNLERGASFHFKIKKG